MVLVAVGMSLQGLASARYHPNPPPAPRHSPQRCVCSSRSTTPRHLCLGPVLSMDLPPTLLPSSRAQHAGPVRAVPVGHAAPAHGRTRPFRLLGACGIRVAGQGTPALSHPEQATKGVCFLASLCLYHRSLSFSTYTRSCPHPPHTPPPGMIYAEWNCPHPLYTLTSLTGFNYVPIHVCRPNRGAACAAAHHVPISCRIHLGHVPLHMDISMAGCLRDLSLPRLSRPPPVPTAYLTCVRPRPHRRPTFDASTTTYTIFIYSPTSLKGLCHY